MTNAELAILSLVTEQPRHGYEIEQVIEERGMRSWTEVGFSSIYYLLKKLEQDDLVTAQIQEAGRGPARRVYSATAAGHEALRQGALATLSAPHRSYPPIQLGLANLPGLKPAEALAALCRYRNALTQRLTEVQSAWDRQAPLPDFIDAMFDHSVTLVTAELDWANRFIARLEADQKGELA